MTDLVLRVGASKLILSLVLALVARAIQGRWNRPGVAHTLWLLVPCVLLVPAVIALPVGELPGWAWIGQLAGVRATTPRAVGVLPGTPSGSGVEWVKRGLVLLWLAGGVLVLSWSLVRAYRFDRRLRTASRPAASGLERLVVQTAREVGLRHAPLVVTTRANVPPLVWWTGGRPRLVIPDAVVAVVRAGELRWILAHELAHIRRQDHRVRWIEWLACVAFWWNPVVWWSRRRLREAEELCCDALVLRSMCADARAYASSLLTVVDVLSSGETLRAPALASGADGGGRTRTIERRLKMIVGGSVTSRTPRWLRVVPGLCVLAVLPLGLTYCGSDDSGSAIVAPAVASDATGASVGRHELTAPTGAPITVRLKEQPSSTAQEEMEAAAAKLERAVRAGDLTPEQAREMLVTLKRRALAESGLTPTTAPASRHRIEAGSAARTGTPTDVKLAPMDRELYSRIEAEARKIRAAVEAGTLTRSEANEKMAALERAATRASLGQGGQRR